MPFALSVSKLFARWRREGPDFDHANRVLIQGMNYAPESIGVGKYASQLAVYLAGCSRGVEVVTAMPHYPAWRVAWPKPWRVASRWEDGIRVTRCPLVARSGGRMWRILAPLSFALTAAPLVIWRALMFRPHVVLCVEPTLFAAPAALLAARLVGARTVLHVQDLEIDAAFATGHLAGQALRRFALAVERIVLRRFDAVVTISDAMADRLQHRGVASGCVTVIRNWIVPQPGGPEAAAAARAALPVPAGRRIVLYAGNLGLKQGLLVLIEAARHLRGRPDLHVLVVGDGPMATVIRAAAASLPNLTILGLQPPEQLYAILAAADCHVLPQDRAAGDLVFPSKLGPILASGRPCVITSDPWRELARWVGDAAVVVPPGDGRALAEALAREVERAAPLDSGAARALAASLDAALVLPSFERVLQPVARPEVELQWGRVGPEFA